MEHYNYEKFMYIGHSLGAVIGKFFNMAYPGHMTRVVELDPVPAHLTWPVTREGIQKWYHYYYSIYNEEKYLKFNGEISTAPTYTYEKALQMTMDTRGISKEATEHVLERCLVPAGDGLYRFTYDQRMKHVTILPFSKEALGQLYTTTTTPTFCVLAKLVLALGYYDAVPFVKDEKSWPNNNYRYKIVEGAHDVHIDNPDCMAEDISKFLLEDLKAKL